MDDHVIARERMLSLLLDGLDDDERSDLEAHLATCTTCRTEQDDLLALAEVLDRHAGATPTTPTPTARPTDGLPPEPRARPATASPDDRPAPPVPRSEPGTTPTEHGPATVEPADGDEAAPAKPTAPLAERSAAPAEPATGPAHQAEATVGAGVASPGGPSGHRSGPSAVQVRRRVLVVAAAAALGLVLVTLVAGIGPFDRDHGRPSGDQVQLALGGAGDAADGTATVRELDTGVGIDLRLSGLAHPGRGTYETWMLRTDGSAVSVGTFEPAADGRADLRLHGTGDLHHYVGLLVTAEPDRDDPARNGPTVATASLPHRGAAPSTHTPEEGTS